MPVTVKFSREFYDKFGHEAVDELVTFLNQVDSGYRGELRALNAQNFARFDDKLERRVTQIEARIDQRTTQLEAKLDQRTAELEAKLDQRTAELEAKLDQRTAELDAKIDKRVAQLDAKIDQRVAQLDSRFDQLRTEIAAARADTIKWMFVFVATAVLAILGLR